VRAKRRRWIVVAASVGLAGGVYAAEQATAPGGDGDLQQTITAQRIGEGQTARTPTDEHQLEAYSPDQMLELAAKYDLEMKTAAEHTENLRIVAYRTRDLIRMTCIDDKLAQMLTVIKMTAPRVQSLGRDQGELLVMREHFTIVQQARLRVSELVTEADQCMGDNLIAVPGGRIQEEAAPATDNVFDPTRPPAPTRDVDRPPEASPYR
jgi:hypothetical protein